MPSGLIDDDDGVGPGSDGEGYFFQMQVHGDGIADGEDQGCPDASCWTDSAEYPGRAGSLILGCDGARAPFGPAPRNLVLLADPGFVLPPNFYGRADRESVADFRHSGCEVFLKVSISSGFWA